MDLRRPNRIRFASGEDEFVCVCDVITDHTGSDYYDALDRAGESGDPEQIAKVALDFVARHVRGWEDLTLDGEPVVWPDDHTQRAQCVREWFARREYLQIAGAVASGGGLEGKSAPFVTARC